MAMEQRDTYSRFLKVSPPDPPPPPHTPSVSHVVSQLRDESLGSRRKSSAADQILCVYNSKFILLPDFDASLGNEQRKRDAPILVRRSLYLTEIT
jgi:hypothetical protein